MTETERSRRAAWEPPVRPDWVARLNEEGRGLDIAGVVPLDSASLIATATGNTGLSDFGTDDWREPLDVFVKSLNDESALSLMGRIMTRSDLLMFLEARLRVEDMYKRHPEIDDEIIDSPIWVLGQGRTGTTMLQTLLSLDPDNRSLSTCDAMFPVPVGSPGKDGQHPQFGIADHRIRMWNRVTPEVMSVHDFAAHEPMETIFAESISLQQPAWLNLLGLAPSYTMYMAKIGMRPALQYGKRVFKLLQWLKPGGRWALKSPDALRYVPDVLAVYPDARLVWSHRDPIKAMSSAVNLIGTLTWVRSDVKPSEGVFDAITDPAMTAASLSQPIDWIESGLIPKERLCNVQYEDLINDPIATVSKAYAHFGLSLSPAAARAIRTHLDAHPRSSRPPHRYSTGGDARVSKERALFQRYEDYFQVPREI